LLHLATRSVMKVSASLSALLLACCASAYEPVFFLHGISSGPGDWDQVVAWVQQVHPGTATFALAAYDTDNSTTPLYEQVAGVWALINDTLQQHGFDSFHLVCHSQGGLTCRTLLQTFNTSCTNFISLSGPHMGQFGLAGQGNWLEQKFPNITTDLAWVYLYEAKIQHQYSPANYWHDPYHQARYLRDVVFLPVMNNETFNPRSAEYKQNFLQVQNVYLYGSPDDGTIVPWESAFFGFWGPSKTGMVAMENQTLYIEDWIGLRTLDEQKRLHSTAVPGVEHGEWLSRFDLFQNYIAPYLT